MGLSTEGNTGAARETRGDDGENEMMKNFISDSEIVYLKILTEDLTAKRRTVE
jgi:hypothetical protein